MKLLNLLFENVNPKVDILFDDATTRVVSFGCTHEILNPEVLSTRSLKELEKNKEKGKCPPTPEGQNYGGYVGYGWKEMWDILQDIKSGKIGKVNALFIDSDIKYEEDTGEDRPAKYPRWRYTDDQKLSSFGVKHGMTGGDTLDYISREYKKRAKQGNLTSNDMNFYLPIGVGLVNYLIDNPDVGNKIDNIVVGNSSKSAADYFVQKLTAVYRNKVKRIKPGELNRTGYIIWSH